jgi:hypothetical protein
VKKSLFAAIMLSLFCCLLQIAPCSAAPGEAKFGTGVTADWNLVNEAREFDTNLITCGFFCAKPFAAMKVTVSVYLQKPQQAEELVLRTDIDVNPKWNILFLPDLPMPSTGDYGFSLSTLAGDVLADGNVKIAEKKVEKEIPAQPSVSGTTLEGLFNKFKPKN